MSYSIAGTIGVFCLILALVTFWLPNPWWWMSVGFVLIAIMISAIRATWEIAGWTQGNIVEKLDKN